MANLIKQNNNLPKNVGIIMDGNGRWALKNSLKVSEGHERGVRVARKVVEAVSYTHLTLPTSR